MIEVREINQIEGLGEFRPAWQSLLARDAGRQLLPLAGLAGMLLEALCGRAAAAGPRGDGRPAAGRHRAAGGADGVDPRRPPPHADLPLAGLGDLLWSDRPEPFRNARCRPAARAANAARLGRARSPLGRRRWHRPGPHRAGHGPDRLPPLRAKVGSDLAGRIARDLAGLLARPRAEVPQEHRSPSAADGGAGQGGTGSLSARAGLRRRSRSALGSL